MKKIIGDKKYDTETATLIGSKDNGLCPCHRFYEKESLYRKATGEFFFVRYRPNYTFKPSFEKDCCFTHKDVPIIRPYSDADAELWAALNLPVDVYEATFGPVAE